MLSLTLSLGVWQLERLRWKHDLLSQIERGEAMAPLPLPSHPEPFRRYTVVGRFAPGQVSYGAEVRSAAAGAAMGAHDVAALLRADAPPVIVDRGWVPTGVLAAPPLGVVTVSGYVRPPEHTPWMGAKDDPAARRFFALDPVAIGSALNIPTVAPFTLVVIGPPGQSPEPVQTLPRPPNDHLSYAATWFSLSAALVAVFLVYARQTLRRKTAP